MAPWDEEDAARCRGGGHAGGSEVPDDTTARGTNRDQFFCCYMVLLFALILKYISRLNLFVD